ncbi:hypothetical protein DH2020_037469 [Rehmannia glutinosa]|uniref:Sulfotransferase n=1 Tax=Rehmannia glutinosa TaxID=99300 RepID=A0ABR0V286_REHGL
MEKSPELNNNQNLNSSLQREKWCGHELLYKFQNFWFPLAYLEATQKVLANFKPVPKDVILASFPKTGTTWLKALLHSIINRSPKQDYNNHPLISNRPHDLIPSLETKLYVDQENDSKKTEFLAVKNPEDVRILATHIPYQILGEVLNSCECKVVYVTRNPKDTLISLWHFVQKSHLFDEDPWELEVAVDQFCNGVVPFGPYYDHVLAYRQEFLKRPQKVFFVTYEEIKENPKHYVRKIGEFLGCPFEGENGEEEIEEIVRFCSFENLSNQEMNKSSELPIDFPMPYNSFFRKGEVGDHINYLEDEMIQKIDAVTKEKFHGSDFVYGV